MIEKELPGIGKVKITSRLRPDAKYNVYVTYERDKKEREAIFVVTDWELKRETYWPRVIATVREEMSRPL